MDAIERYLAPTTLQQALAVLGGPGGATVLAGGTDLMPQGRAGRVKPAPTLLNIRRIPELEPIALEGDTLVLGALARIADLERHPLVRAHAPLLAEVADHFASPQVRNAATLGGNVCNASPAGDMLPALLALDAEIELACLGSAGAIRRRRLPLHEFFVGPGRTRREPQELLTAVRVPLSATPRLSRFYKGGTRPALDISPVAIAFAAQRDAQRRLHGVRVAFGAVGPTPLLARKTQALLEGRVLDGPLAAEAAQLAAGEATPIDDVRASAWYRRELLRNMTRRILTDVADH